MKKIFLILIMAFFSIIAMSQINTIEVFAIKDCILNEDPKNYILSMYIDQPKFNSREVFHFNPSDPDHKIIGHVFFSLKEEHSDNIIYFGYYPSKPLGLDIETEIDGVLANDGHSDYDVYCNLKLDESDVVKFITELEIESSRKFSVLRNNCVHFALNMLKVVNIEVETKPDIFLDYLVYSPGGFGEDLILKGVMSAKYCKDCKVGNEHCSK